MRSHRSYLVNNCLVHGMCNYACGLCSVNKAVYVGPRAFQPREVTEALMRRIQEAAGRGLRVRFVGFSGHGEPTLHPEFGERVDLLGKLVREWKASLPPPVVSVVTNGSRLLQPGVLDAFVRNPVRLTVSMPTTDPQAYARIMGREPSQLAEVLEGVDRALALWGQGRLKHLHFHVSPPEQGVIREHFPQTLDDLAGRAARFGVSQLYFTLFPAVSNRSGALGGEVRSVDTFRDLFRHYHGQRIRGVQIALDLSLHAMFPSNWHLADHLWAYRYPCLWNANFLIAADGSSLCINDQSATHPFGNVLNDDLITLVERKEDYLPGPLCDGCNQRPTEMRGSPLAWTLARLSRIRIGVATR